MPEIMIFKSGTYPQGDWPKERVQRMVDAYDPEKSIEACVVIGHRDSMNRLAMDNDEAQFSHGWIESLRMDGAGKVYAEIPEVSDEAKAAMAQKKLRYVSAEIYEFDEVDPEQPPYLRAIALLGRDIPAIATTRLPTFFSLLTGGGISTLDKEQHLIAFTRKMNVSEFSEPEPTPTTKPNKDSLDTTTGEQSNYKHKESTMTNEEKLQQQLAEKEKELTAFKKENETLKSTAARQDAESFYSELRDNGILPPAHFEATVTFDENLTDEQRQGFRAIVSAFETKVDTTGTHAASKKKAGSIPETEPELAEKIKAFQAERKIDTFENAAKILYQEKPELFAGGE